MSDSFDNFDRRVAQIEKKHARTRKHGSKYVMTADGLIMRKSRRRFRIPVRGLVLLTIGIIGFKGLLIAHLGESLYQDRVAKLAEGTIVEQAGAFIMTQEQASTWVADMIRPYLR